MICYVYKLSLAIHVVVIPCLPGVYTITRYCVNKSVQFRDIIITAIFTVTIAAMIKLHEKNPFGNDEMTVI